MKQTLTALLLALTMLFSLSGCTRKDTPNDSMNSSGNSGTANSDTANDGNINNGTMNGGTNSDSNHSTTNPAARDRYGTYNSHGTPGSNSATDSESSNNLMDGRSYEQMLRDGRVHDSDGFLTDGENSVTEW